MHSCKNFFFILAILSISFFSFPAFAGAAQVIEFKSLPTAIQTNIGAFPVTGMVPSTTTEVYVNGQLAPFDPVGLDFFEAVPLLQGNNSITLKVVEIGGAQSSYTRTVSYNPAYSTADKQLVYANSLYNSQGVKVPGILVIDTKANIFLGIIRNRKIEGITKDGKEIILDNAQRWSTASHSFTGKSIPNFNSLYELVFSNDNKTLYHMSYQIDLPTNTITKTLPQAVSKSAGITVDNSKVVIYSGYISTATNTFTAKNYIYGASNSSPVLGVEPAGNYVLNSSYSSAKGILNILNASTGSLLNSIKYSTAGDYAGDIVFSPDGKKAYAGFYGNTWYGYGGILTIDMQTLAMDSKLNLHGPRSMAIGEDGKVYASAFYTLRTKRLRGTPEQRGIIQLAPTADKTGLTVEKIFFVSLLSSMNEPYYDSKNIFYKPATGIACSSNAQCGTDIWTGTTTCSNNDVYQNYITYTCNNPGTTSSYCNNTTTSKLKQDCGTTTYGAWGTNYCSANNVARDRTVYNKGCTGGACYANTTTETQTVQTCANGCTSGTCNTGGTDYTDRTCNINGSASPTGVKCGDPLNKNEDSTDATYDSCTDGTSNSYMHIEDIFVDATTVKTTDTVQVTCNVCCYSSATEYAILYNSGSGWVNKQYGNCTSGSGTATCTAIESKTISIPIDDVEGTHYFRCWESYSGCDATTQCCSTTYADNDDMSISVIGVTCSTNSDCGTDAWTGTTTCSNDDVYQNYITYTCNNPGTASAFCSNSTTSKLKQDCGTTTYEPYGANYCSANNVVRSRTVHNKGCTAGTCYANDTAETQTVQTCTNGCTSGTCNAGPTLVEFSTLPASIETNLNAFPVAGRVNATTTAVYVNGTSASIDTTGKDYFTVVDLNQGTNNITVRIVDSSGSQTTYTKAVNYNYFYSTSQKKLVYANAKYTVLGTTTLDKALLVIDPAANTFLGAIKGKWIEGIFPNGQEIILNTGERYSTASHGYLSRTVPNFSGRTTMSYYQTSKSIISNDSKYLYHKSYKIDLATNTVAQNLPATISQYGNILKDNSRVILSQGYIDTATNTFTAKNYFNGYTYYLGDVAGSPTGQYVLNTSFGYAVGTLNILDAGTANILNTINYPYAGDYPGSIVFSPSGGKAYAGFYGNSWYGNGGILTIDMQTLAMDSKLNLHGPRSMAIGEDGKVYASAFYTYNAGVFIGTPEKRGIIELAPAADGKGLEEKKVFFASLESSTTADYYYGMENIFVKNGITAACSSNAQCGTDAWTGTTTCTNSDVYQNYITYTCNNPGTTSAYCSNSTTSKLKQDCGTTTYDAYGANYCSANNVVRSRTVHNKGCTAGACYANDTTQVSTVQICTYGCTSGTCNTAPVCTTNTDCGTDAWTGTTTCSNSDVYQNYITYTCNNPGTTSAYCSNSTTSKLKQDCGTTTYGAWGTNYCSGSNVVRTRTVYNRGCAAGACYTNNTTETQTVQTCQYGCSSGACIIPACTSNAQCGTDAWAGTAVCQSGNVYQSYITYTCNSPGTASAYCSNSTAAKLKETCTNGCSAGACVIQGGNLILYDSLDSSATVQANGGTQNGGSFATGMKGNAYVVGPNNYIQYPYAGNFDYNKGTVQFLVKPTDTSSMGMFESGNLGYANSLGIVRIDVAGRQVALLEMRMNDSSYLQAWHDSEQARLKSNTGWYLVTAVWQCNKGSTNEDFFQLYINNVPGYRHTGNVCTSFLEPSAKTLRLGTTVWYGTGEGTYDELKIYSYAKTQAEIATDYSNYFNGSVQCYNNINCGTDVWAGSTFCQSGSVYQNYTAYVCNNPGTAGAYCSNSTQPVLRTTCQYGCSAGQCLFQTKPTSTGKVKVVGRDLYVDGQLFEAKTIGYAPVPIGQNPNYGYDITVHPELRARDFPLLRAMNANSIRTWGKVGETAFLDDAWNNGTKPLMVIMGYWMGPEKDYQNQAVRNAILADFNQHVMKYKSHPAVLMWAIGNEENYFYGGSDNAKHSAYFSLVNQMAQNAYAIEGAAYHPVMALALEMPGQMATVGNFEGGADDASLRYVDIWGVNHYPGQTFGNFFNTYEGKTSKPLIVTEYGIDALNNVTKAEQEAAQAQWDLALWQEISASSVAAGGSLMEYCDEWFKASGSDSSHDYGGYATSSHPDGYANEEWWGIMRTQDNGTLPDIMTPRQVYYTLQQAFA